MESKTVNVMSARRLLRELSGEGVSTIVLDPPSIFGVHKHDNDTQIEDMISELMDIAELAVDALRPGGATVFMGSPTMLSAWELVASMAGLNLSAEITVLWMGVDQSSRAMSVRWHVQPGRRYGGTPRTITVPSNVIACNEVPLSHRYSTTQKPVELYNYLISLLSDDTGIIVDPFCGTGSSLISAEMCGRDWIGGDIKEDSVVLSRRRIKQIELEEGDLGPLFLWVNGNLRRIEG